MTTRVSEHFSPSHSDLMQAVINQHFESKLLRGLQEIPDDGSKLTARNNNRFSIHPKNTRVRYSTNKLRPSEPRSRLLGNVTQLNHFET